MLKFIKELGKYVAMAGFKEVKIESIEGFLAEIRKERLPDTYIQFFDARFVATWQHLYFAALNALMAFENDDNISKDAAVESMLYASAQRQIRKAMNLLGIKDASSEMAVLVMTEKPESAQSVFSDVLRHIKGKRDDTILKLSKRKVITIKEVFGISDVELKTALREDGVKKALIGLVIERMALLATQH